MAMLRDPVTATMVKDALRVWESFLSRLSWIGYKVLVFFIINVIMHLIGF